MKHERRAPGMRRLLPRVRIAILAALTIPVVAAAQTRVHEVARPIEPPSCGAAQTVCLSDTTRSATIGECCMDYATARWLLLGLEGDSVELFAIPRDSGVSAILTLEHAGLGRSWQEHLPGVTAPFIRHRFTDRGPHVLDVMLSSVSPTVGMPYELRVARISGSPSSRDALLTLTGGARTQYLVQPFPLSPVNRSALTVPGGLYRVYAPGVDSIRVCRAPCRTWRVARLAESGASRTH